MSNVQLYLAIGAPMLFNAVLVGILMAYTSSKIDSVKETLRAEIGKLGSDLRKEMADMRAELKGDIGTLRSEMREMRSDLKAEIKEVADRRIIR